MPELPDLLYIQKYLVKEIRGRTIKDTLVKQQVVLRVAIPRAFESTLRNLTIKGIHLRGPFLRFELSNDVDIILNLMLAGRLQHQRDGEKTDGHLCCSLFLDDASRLNLCDDERMAKLYVVASGDYLAVPRFTAQGVDILSREFTRSKFGELLEAHSRKQVRVFINDHTILSAIGNAYADEILFEARIHPKTFVGKLRDEERDQLFAAIPNVMKWGCQQVTNAGQPIQKKVRNHMRVRNRHGEPCVHCGTKIRREGVRGYDVYFCPQCQPAGRTLFIDWSPASPQNKKGTP